MPMILPLTKGLLSTGQNYLAEGMSLLEGDYCSSNAYISLHENKRIYYAAFLHLYDMI